MHWLAGGTLPLGLKVSCCDQIVKIFDLEQRVCSDAADHSQHGTVS